MDILLKFKMDKINRIVSIFLLMTLFIWTLNWPGFIKSAGAAQLTLVSDTISTSAPGVKANHTVKFTLKNPVSASSTIVIAFDNTFQSTSSPAFANSDANDYDIASSTLDLTVVVAGSCPTSGSAAFEITSISASTFTFTHCALTLPVAATTPVTVKIGTNATVGGTGDSQLVNPSATGSYVVRVTAPTGDAADTRVAIVNQVTVTASVATNFTFTVAGVASGQSVNGDGTTTSSGATATALPFGTISPSTPEVLAQTLTVSTNAKNGFTVGVFQDQNLTSANGADIDQFKDGSGTVTPEAWAAPSATIDVENTYGHFGLTSEDADLSGDEFGTALYAAIGTSTPRTVFSHTGPANGVTANKGLTRVGYKMEISALQEAAEDYTNILTYIATPTF